MKLDVVISPAVLEKHDMQGRVCIVIDVLRATSTITVALAAGAGAVRPCLSIEEARAAASQDPHSLLGGEEMGTLIPGFDLGNSPFEYMKARTVRGRTICFYTTNGSGAIRNAYERSGRDVYIGSLLNLSAVVSQITQDAALNPEAITVLCSGRSGKLSAEDMYCAGLVVNGLAVSCREAGRVVEYTDSAAVAAAFASSKSNKSLEVIRGSEHGRYLESLGFARDLEFASRIDTYDIVPVFNGSLITRMAPRS